MSKIKSFKLIWCGFWTELRFKRKIISKESFYSVFYEYCFRKRQNFSHLLTLLPFEKKNLSICKEVRSMVGFCYSTVSVFISYQVPKTDRKKRRKKETDLVSHSHLCYIISYCIYVDMFKEYVYQLPIVQSFLALKYLKWDVALSFVIWLVTNGGFLKWLVASNPLNYSV